MRKLLTVLALVAGSALAETAALEQARSLYQKTRYAEALKVIESLPQADGARWELAGRCRYMLDDFKGATEAFEKALAAEPKNSVYANWLGKAHGRRAETSSFLTAPGQAKKARQAFEKAVALDPRNLEAVGDLFEYYLEAPGFLGGGAEKAAELAERSKDLNPAEYHFFFAKLAEKRKDLKTAEAEYQRAIELAPGQVGRVIDLARFLAKQGRHEESDAAFRQAEKIAPGAPKLLFAQASTYVRSKRNLGTARSLLERYLTLVLTPDDPPRREAERLLKEARTG